MKYMRWLPHDLPVVGLMVGGLMLNVHGWMEQPPWGWVAVMFFMAWIVVEVFTMGFRLGTQHMQDVIQGLVLAEQRYTVLDQVDQKTR